MFTNNKNIEMKYYTYLEVFLAVISKLNPTIFHQFETLEIDLEKLEEFYKLKDIQLAEQKLHSLFENETFNIKLPIHISKNDISSELKTINDIYFNNKNIFDTNEDFYRSYISSNELKTKRDLIDLLKETKDNEVSENHIDLINKAKRIIVIPSFFIYPQFGFNLIDKTLYLIIGIKEKNKTSKLSFISLATCFSALSEPNRLEILKLIKDDKQIIAKEIAKKLSLTTATVSHHLNTLAQASILSREKIGRKYTYKLEESRLENLCEFLKKLK